MRALLCCAAVAVAFAAAPSAQRRRPLSPADVDAIAQILALEDTRTFDEEALGRLVQSSHPDVRRRAVIAVGRIVKAKGSALLAQARTDQDPEVVAAAAFAYGQLKDPAAVEWLAGMMKAGVASTVSREAARSLGKIRSDEARNALAKYLDSAPAIRPAVPIVGEALLSYGRFTGPGTITPILRWTTHADVEIRWRAAWALFRLRDAAATPHLLTLASDRSAEVRFWAVRGLAPALVTGAAMSVDKTAALLRTLTRDPDRRVRTEALRSLAQYDDDESVQVVLSLLDSSDSWLAVSAAEGLARMKDRAAVVVPRLIAASATERPLAVRITALTALVAMAPDAAIEAAASLVRERSLVARASGIQALGRLGAAGQARLGEMTADAATKDLVAEATPVRGPRAEPIKRSPEEYRRIVERWILPAYKGSPKPHAILGTPRGEIEIELHGGDAPLGVEYFVHVVESGEIVGTEFGRVVPNFVAQQRPVRNAALLRDEVSRLGLTRGNVSWASAGLDTGRPGYTFGVTPQPHNEGDFTALGRVVRGMDAVERLELGDAITSAKMIR